MQASLPSYSFRPPAALMAQWGRRLLWGSMALCLVMVSDGHAQSAPQHEQEASPSSQALRSQSISSSFLDGWIVGLGFNTFHGDVDSDPQDYDFLRALITAGLEARIGVDRRVGSSHQYGMEAHLVYDRIYGKRPTGAQFTNNMLTLDLVGNYELPIDWGSTFRIFGGGGPTLLLQPSYSEFPNTGGSKVVDERRTRFVGTFVGGVSIANRIRIGTRIATTDFLDGFRTKDKNFPVDILGFITFGYRFDLSN